MTKAAVADHVWRATKRSGAILPDGDRLLLARLWSYADHEDRRRARARDKGLDEPELPFVCPAIETIQTELGCSERTVYDRLARLDDAGWIRRSRQVLMGRSCLGWELAEESRFCGSPQVDLRQPGEKPAVARSAPPQVHLRASAGSPAGHRMDPCGQPHHTQTQTDDVINEGSVVDLDAHRSRVLDPEAEHRRIEREAVALVVNANVGAGVGADGRYVVDIVRRIQGGECTMDDVRAIARRYKRWKDDNVNQQQFNLLFYDKSWPWTQRVYLDRTPTPQPKLRSSAALSGLREHWAKVTADAEAAQPVDEKPYTDEDAMRDYLAMTGGSAT